MNRLFDILISLFILISVWPGLLVVAILIRWKIGRPIFFLQKRAGLNEKPFIMIKFRTMRELYGEDGKPLPDELRLTPIGRYLRSTSIDEVPELWNVLRGDMSIVGPRPLPVEYLPLYTPKQSRRHQVRPGITGWAQVNGRNAIAWEEKFELDVWYRNNKTILLDLKIIFMTIATVVKRSGINNSEGMAMPVFTGTNNNIDREKSGNV